MILVRVAPKCRAGNENLGADGLFGDDSQRSGSEGGEKDYPGCCWRWPNGRSTQCAAGRSPPCMGKPEQPPSAQEPIGWGFLCRGLALWTSSIDLCSWGVGCSWENILQWNTDVGKLILEVERAEQGEPVLLTNCPRWLLRGHLLQPHNVDTIETPFLSSLNALPLFSTEIPLILEGSSRCHVLCEASLVLWPSPSDFYYSSFMRPSESLLIPEKWRRLLSNTRVLLKICLWLDAPKM